MEKERGVLAPDFFFLSLSLSALHDITCREGGGGDKLNCNETNVFEIIG